MVMFHSYVTVYQRVVEPKNLVAQLSSNLRMEIICVAMRSRQGEHPLRSGSDHHPAISRGADADSPEFFGRMCWVLIPQEMEGFDMF